MGIYGSKRIHTPHLNMLAGASAVFYSACIGSFAVVPDRGDRYLGRGYVGAPFNRCKSLEPNEIPLAERLGEKGIPSRLTTDTQNAVIGGRDLSTGYTAW
jgi:hypothetical protein